MGCGNSKQKSPRQSSIATSNKINNVDDIIVNPALFVFESGQRFNEAYRMGEILGNGAFGDVLWCVRRDTGARRAVKVCRKEAFTTKQQQIDMVNEVAILKTLDHPNIIRVYETFEDQKRYFIVMELCKGGELFEQIAKRAYFTEKQAGQIMQQLFSAVAYFHSQDIVHRDLKPENILLEDRQDFLNIKIIDFGTAVRKQGKQKVRGSIGTAYYIAPEVLEGTYDERCDMWSCGVIMYILLCGHAPFEGETDYEIIANVRVGAYSFTGPVWEGISHQAKDLISRLLIPANNRLNSIQALEHPWVKQYENTNIASTAAYGQVLQNLRHFKSTNVLKNAVQTYITTNMLSSKDIKELRDIFKAIDTNGDGKLDREELLKHYSELLGAELAESEVDRIMKQVDTDHNGSIEYTEFINATIDQKKFMTKSNLFKAFKLFDRDDSGKISAQELKRILEGGGESNDEVWNSIISAVDKNGDGEIDFEEFEAIVLENSN